MVLNVAKSTSKLKESTYIHSRGRLAGYTPASPSVYRHIFLLDTYSDASLPPFVQYSGSIQGDFSLNLYCTSPSTAPCFHSPLKESPLDSSMQPWPSFRPSFQ